jgi:hypothetical protein
MSENTAAPTSGTAPSATAPSEPGQQSAATVTESKATEAKVEEAVRKFKLKINGGEREYDEKSVIALAQKGAASDEKFQKASEMQKTSAELAKLWETDPERAMKELGKKDPIEFAKAILAREIKKMSLSPEQLELEDAREKLKVYENEKATKAEQARAESEKQATQFFIQQYDKEIPTELAKVGLPVNEDTVRYTAEVMLANLEKGWELPYELVMATVKEKYQGQLKNFFSKSDPSKLVELIGQDAVDKLLAAMPKKERAQVKQALQTGGPSQVEQKTESKEEFRKRIEEWAKK